MIENGPVGVIEIFDEEPIDAVYKFGKLHRLNDRQRHELLENICESLTCTRKHALIWSAPVAISDQTVELFQVFEGNEAADELYNFANRYNLTEDYSYAILNDVCSVIECSRTEPGEN